jgi:hypothetical protein
MDALSHAKLTPWGKPTLRVRLVHSRASSMAGTLLLVLVREEVLW